MNIIETKNLTKSYGSKRGIDNLELTIMDGDFFGFIGPNGAGKSTTIRTLLGLISPTSGDAHVLGFDIRQDSQRILENVGYLPSEINFYNGMKVRDAIDFSAALHLSKKSKAEKLACKEKSKSLCERLGLDPSRKVSELSLGNRKKVGIVCAVQHSPKLLILDEPTSGLDPLMQREFFNILTEENRAGSTIFFSSHILSEVESYCHSAAFIKEGKIIMSDKVENLEDTGAKKISIKGDASKLGSLLEGSLKNNISDIKKDEYPEKNTYQHISFLYRGDIGRLLNEIGKTDPVDLNISEPPLEEIFMNYYE